MTTHGGADRYLGGLALVGNTPVLKLPLVDNADVYAKLELMNPTGSVKDRAAAYVLDAAIANGRINQGTLVVESTSGNFGIALAAACSVRGLTFCSVIDPRINPANELLLRGLGARVVKVDKLDPTGGYLRTRMRTVEAICERRANSFWVNQYGNPDNARAYSETLAPELIAAFERIDYLFVGVSSGGTIAGLSRRMTEHYPDIRIVAVDTVGSIIFGAPPAARWLPGIGASVRSANVDEAKIHDVVHVEESVSAQTCRELWRHHGILAGGSTGSVVAAIRRYCKDKTWERRPVIVTLFPDRGDRYADTIYNDEWLERLCDGTLRRSVYPPPLDGEQPSDLPIARWTKGLGLF